MKCFLLVNSTTKLLFMWIQSLSFIMFLSFFVFPSNADNPKIKKIIHVNSITIIIIPYIFHKMSTIPINTRHDDWCRGVADYWCWLIPCFNNCIIGQWSMNQQPAIRCSSQFPPRPTIHKMKSQAGVGQRMPTNPHVLRWFILEKKIQILCWWMFLIWHIFT